MKTPKNRLFYSGGENDIFVFLQAGPVELLNPKIREKINNPLSYYVDKAIVNIKNNIDMLIYLNQNVDIYVLGAYNSPINNFIQKIINIYDKIKGNNLTKNMLSFLVKELNEKLYELCSNYNNVHYVNIEFLENHCASFDFHPNKEGNILIGSEIMKNLTENDIEKQKIKKL